MERAAIGSAATFALLLVPVAVAADGQMIAADGVEFPESTQLTLSGSELYLPNASSLGQFSLVADRLRVTRYDYATLNVGTIQVVTDDAQASYTLTSANATLSGTGNDAWMGTYSSIDTTLTASATAPFIVSAAPGAKMGNTITPEQDPDPGRQAYSRSYSSSVLRADTRGAISLQGDFSIKLTGIDLQVRSRENTSNIYTTVNTEGPTARHQWAYLEVSGGELILLTSSDVAFVGRDGTASWLGHARLHGASGAMRDGVREFIDLPSELTVAGNLSATMSPLGARAQGVAFSMEGDLVSTNAAPRIFVPTRGGSGWLLPVGLAVLVAVALGGVGAARRLSTVRVHADDWLRLADDAASRREFGAAAEYLEMAIQRIGKSPRLLIDRAFYLAESGRVDDAVAAYREACRVTSNGEPELLLARLQHSVGRTEPAVWALIDALRKEPAYVFDMEGDAILLPLAEDPRVAAESEHARRRLRPPG